MTRFLEEVHADTVHLQPSDEPDYVHISIHSLLPQLDYSHVQSKPIPIILTTQTEPIFTEGGTTDPVGRFELVSMLDLD